MTCYRCGKENVDVHTCSPTKQYLQGFIHGVNQKKECEKDKDANIFLVKLVKSYEKYLKDSKK